jgi:hypothetical protein
VNGDHASEHQWRHDNNEQCHYREEWITDRILRRLDGEESEKSRDGVRLPHEECSPSCGSSYCAMLNRETFMGHCAASFHPCFARSGSLTGFYGTPFIVFRLTTGAEPPCGCRSVTKLDLQCRKGKSSPKRILDSKVGSSDLLDRFGLQVQDICI